MKSSIALTLLLLPLTIAAQYEFPKKELCIELEQRTLAVQLLEGKNENERNLNKALTSVFTNWTHTPVVFKTWEQIAVIIDDNDSNYALLMQEDQLRQDIRMMKVDSDGKKIFSYSAASGRNYYNECSFAFHNFSLILPGKRKLEEITAIGFANSDLSLIDYTFLLQQLNLLIDASLNDVAPPDFSNVENNMSFVKAKKLLILQDYFKEKEIEKIADVYEDNYRMVDFSTYQKAILNKEEGTCYSKFIWSNQAKTYVLAVVNSANGSVVAHVEFDKSKMKKKQTAEGTLKANDVKAISHPLTQKGNNWYK